MEKLSNGVMVATSKAPVNIAVIKYWGKSDEKLKIPVNDSISCTLNIGEMCSTTSVYMSAKYAQDRFWLNDKEEDITNDKSPVRQMLNNMRELYAARLAQQPGDGFDATSLKVHIVSENNFPTAAGLASSASGQACLAYTAGLLFGITNNDDLTRLARKGSGSACRSIYGGFVHWCKGTSDETSIARPLFDENHWSELKILICVVNDRQKEVPSGLGMARSVATSSLLKFRADQVVLQRVADMKHAIERKDFQKFADITMRDSNQFHAICMDTFPPIFYLNDTSRSIIKLCTLINSFYQRNVVAYTFDAGPNACLFALDSFIDDLIEIVDRMFPREENGLITSNYIRGTKRAENPTTNPNIEPLMDYLVANNLKPSCNKLGYLINTSIGSGPFSTRQHLADKET